VLQFDIGGRNYVILNEADFQMIIGEVWVIQTQT
jgi:hypothetical protein